MTKTSEHIKKTMERFDEEFVATLAPTGLRAVQVDAESLEQFLLTALQEHTKVVVEEVEGEKKQITYHQDEEGLEHVIKNAGRHQDMGYNDAVLDQHTKAKEIIKAVNEIDHDR